MYGGGYTNRRAKVHKKWQLKTPSFRLPLLAGGTKPLRFPSRSGGNLKEGGIVNFGCAVGIRFAACKAFAFFRPHPQPLSHDRDLNIAPPPQPSPHAGSESRLLPRVQGRLGGGHFEKPTHRHLPTAQSKFTIPPSLRFPPLREGNRRGLVPPASRGNPEGGGRQLPFFVNFGSAIGMSSPTKRVPAPDRHLPLRVKAAACPEGFVYE